MFFKSIPQDVYQGLMREDLVFDNSDKFFQSAGVYKEWPIGRGVYLTPTKGFY